MRQAGHIHVVDDDAAMRTSLTFALQAIGFRVSSYVDAHDYLSRAQQEWGVLISDVRMPDMNGVEFCRLLQQYEPPMPVILLTGNVDATLRARAADAGAQSVLEKPVALAMLLAEITRITQQGPPDPG